MLRVSQQKRILRVTYEEVYGDQGVGLILPVDECLESELGLVQARELGLLPACGTTGTPYAEEEDKEGQATGSKQEGGDRPKDAVVEVRDADANAVLSGSRHSQLTVATSISASSPELKPTSSHTSNESDECLQAHLFSGEVDSATAQAGPVRALVTAQDIKVRVLFLSLRCFLLTFVLDRPTQLFASATIAEENGGTSVSPSPSTSIRPPSTRTASPPLSCTQNRPVLRTRPAYVSRALLSQAAARAPFGPPTLSCRRAKKTCPSSPNSPATS